MKLASCDLSPRKQRIIVAWPRNMNIVKSILKTVFRSTMRLLFVFWSVNKKHRNILFMCNGSIMIREVANVWELLKDDKRLQLRLLVVTNKEESQEELTTHAEEKIPIKQIHREWAFVKSWDLIIIADHTLPELVDKQNCPTVYIGHGFHSGKLVNGQIYTSGNRIFNKNGKIRYKSIFVSSYCMQKNMTKNIPELSETVKVVGNINFDKLKNLDNQRAKIRSRLGFDDKDAVVFVMSTWGPNCLWQSTKNDILPEMIELRNEFRFILSAHPNEYRPNSFDGQQCGKYLQEQRQNGFVVLGPSEDWQDYIIACDIIVSDHTSLAIYGALLGRPIVYISIADELIVKDGIVWRLREISPVIRKDCSNLRECLFKAQNDYPANKLNQLSKDIISYPGQSQTLVKKELYALLQLPIRQE